MTLSRVQDGPQSGFAMFHCEGTADVAICLGSVLNPEGCAVQITEGYLHLVEGSHAANTLNIGFAATGVDAEELTHDFPGNGGDDTWWTIVARGAAEAAMTGAQNGTLWPAAEYLTVTNAAAASTGMVFDLYLRYVRIDNLQ